MMRCPAVFTVKFSVRVIVISDRMRRTPVSALPCSIWSCDCIVAEHQASRECCVLRYRCLSERLLRKLIMARQMTKKAEEAYTGGLERGQI